MNFAGPTTAAPGALAVAERLRTDIAELDVDGLRVTVSLGVATYPDLQVEGSEPLVDMADQALYASKEGGRNRTTAASGATPPA